MPLACGEIHNHHLPVPSFIFEEAHHIPLLPWTSHSDILVSGHSSMTPLVGNSREGVIYLHAPRSKFGDKVSWEIYNTTDQIKVRSHLEWGWSQWLCNNDFIPLSLSS